MQSEGERLSHNSETGNVCELSKKSHEFCTRIKARYGCIQFQGFLGLRTSTVKCYVICTTYRHTNCSVCALGPSVKEPEEYRPKMPADVDPKLMKFIDSSGKW